MKIYLMLASLFFSICHADIIYLTDFLQDVWSFDTRNPAGTFTIAVTFPTVTSSGAIDLSDDTKTGYVADFSSRNVYDFDTTNNTLLTPSPFLTISTGHVYGLSTGLTNRLYVSDGGTSPGFIYVYDQKTASLLSTFTVPSGYIAGNLDISPDGTTGYMSSSLQEQITIFNPQTGVFGATISVTVTVVPPLPFNTGVSPDGKRVFAVTESGDAYVFNAESPPATLTDIIFTVPQSSANDVVVGHQLGYVSDNTGNTVFSFNANGLPSYMVSSPLVVLPTGLARLMAILLLDIPTTGLKGQVLDVANVLNSLPYTPNNMDILAPLATLTGKALEQALETICPARNAFPSFAAANAQFAASDVVQDHQRMKRFVRHTRRRLREQEHHKPTGYNELFSDATQELLLATLSIEASSTPSETDVSQQDSSSSTLPGPKTQMATEPAPSFRKMVSPWFEVFGEYARQKAQKQSPSFKDSLGGAVLALDLYNYKATLFGAGLAYTYSYVHEGAGAGHATINQEYAVVYGTFEFRKFYADPAVWGALMQISNTRHLSTPGLTADATSSPHGWMLSPHLEIGYDIDRDWLTVEPFAMFDWPNVWEDSFHEEGAGSLNMTQPQHHSSMLRSELGFRFYQAIRTRYARCILQEKASYVNKKPFQMGSVTAFITGAPGSFTVDTLSGDQNLGCAEIEFLYDPDNKSRPYISISYQGETSFTGAYYSHLVMASMGKEF